MWYLSTTLANKWGGGYRWVQMGIIFNTSMPNDGYMCQLNKPALVHIMAHLTHKNEFNMPSVKWRLLRRGLNGQISSIKRDLSPSGGKWLTVIGWSKATVVLQKFFFLSIQTWQMIAGMHTFQITSWIIVTNLVLIWWWIWSWICICVLRMLTLFCRAFPVMLAHILWPREARSASRLRMKLTLTQNFNKGRGFSGIQYDTQLSRR